MRILSLIMFMFSLSAFSSEYIDASGQVFFKKADGVIEKKPVTLLIPKRGEGQAYLKSGRILVEAEKYFSVDKNGRKIFYMIFDQFIGQKNKEKAVFRGTYIRGTNKALYYGDVFLVGDLEGSEQDLDFELSNLDQSGRSIQYNGGFYFNRDLQQDAETDIQN